MCTTAMCTIKLCTISMCTINLCTKKIVHNKSVQKKIVHNNFTSKLGIPMLYITTVPVGNQITTLGVVKISIEFSPCTPVL